MQTFIHFDKTVQPILTKHILSFITYAQANFISEFRDSANATSILPIEGKPYDGFIPINCSGGFAIREEYRNDVDTCSHFTKEQSLFKTRQAAQSLVYFCANNKIDVDTALSEEYQDELTEWESDLHQPALLELRCAVRKGKIVIDLALDYVSGDVFDWNLLYETEFTVSAFLGLDFDGFFEGLATVVNRLGV